MTRKINSRIFAKEVERLLPPEILNQSGKLLYSSVSTLKKGNFYILGLNPGGNPKEISETILENLDNLRQNKKGAYQNAYIDEKWSNHRAQQNQSPDSHAGWPPAAPLRPPLENRAALCLALQLPPTGGPL
jgi:hypothetical protein